MLRQKRDGVFTPEFDKMILIKSELDRCWLYINQVWRIFIKILPLKNEKKFKSANISQLCHFIVTFFLLRLHVLFNCFIIHHLPNLSVSYALFSPNHLASFISSQRNCAYITIGWFEIILGKPWNNDADIRLHYCPIGASNLKQNVLDAISIKIVVAVNGICGSSRLHYRLRSR